MMNLNKDCLILIVKELDDDDSLHSCILVNKLWHETALPILWKNPWRFLKKEKDNNNHEHFIKKMTLFFNIILSHLSQESINLLRKDGIDIVSKPRKLSFNYIGFCNSIDHQLIYMYIHEIYNGNYYQRLLLEKEILNLFINKCVRFDYLNINDKMKIQIHQFPGVMTSLSKLYELHCTSNIDPMIFYGLAQICRFIEKFNITLSGDNPGLAILIEKQQRIKYLQLNLQYENDFYKESGEFERYARNDNNKHKYERLGQALDKHAITLLYLNSNIMWENDFIINFLPKLINLQLLSLQKFYVSNFIENQLSISKFSKLQILDLFSISLQTTIKIIEKTDGNLWKIKLSYYNLSDKFFSGKLIQTICQKCPNLKDVHILLTNAQDLFEFEKLLINCQNLERIIIDPYFEDNNKIDSNQLLDILINSSPISLYKIHIGNSLEFTIDALDLFFKKWQGRKPLWLSPVKLVGEYINWDDIENINDDEINICNELLNLLKEYKMKGVIKKYRYSI